MRDSIKKKIGAVSRSALGIILLASTLAGAGVLISSSYHIAIPGIFNGSASTSSGSYSIQNGTLGQTISGRAESSNYRNSGEFSDQAAVMAMPPSADLGNAYVYPNPFKPNSPGSFHADKITFKHLPAEAAIRIFEITGRKVIELHKTDTTVDYYEWDAANDKGRKIASGVYLFYITAQGGGRAKGKFAVIR